MSNESEFPIVEAFGFDHDADTPAAQSARADKRCPFAGSPCEKYRQYGYGYCSVRYAAEADEGVRQTYAVCDHRLDGDPLRMVVADHFTKGEPVRLVPEVVLTNPRTSFDYVAISVRGNSIEDQVAIETQAIDLRGGGVGPAWRAWQEGTPDQWREYFTAEAKTKGRRDTVDYGVNMANIMKRLGQQVVEKGSFLKRIGVPLYIVMQDRPFRYLYKRIPFQTVLQGREWDITFMTFDYSGRELGNGQLEFAHKDTVRTTVGYYAAAMAADSRPPQNDRAHFLQRVKRKAGLT